MIAAAVFGLVLCALLCFWRVMRGPTLLDRVAAADAMGIMLTVVLVLLALKEGRDLLLDVAMVYALLLFADVLIIARYMERKGKAS